jgi:hypothetical protein
MLLTSHRLDCFRLTMDQLFETGEIRKFDKVVLLLNGVEGEHLHYVNGLVRANPDVPFETLAGPRGKGKLVAGPQNEVVRSNPDRLYFKIDEDILVPRGWVDRMTAAYEAYRDHPKKALLTPLVTNNATGFHALLRLFPELKAEYERRFPGREFTPRVDGPVWREPDIAEWILRTFLNLEQANERVRAQVAATSTPVYEEFAHRFSINNLVYDYQHWTELGGIPDAEEPAWTQWIADQGKVTVLVKDVLLHHYSFFVQQDWLDRTSLLEDLRQANLPSSLPSKSLSGYYVPRWKRLAQQLPAIVKRRLGAGK